MIEYVVAIAFVIVLKWSWDRYHFLKLRDEMGIPGPPVRFPLGNIDYIIEDIKKYGKEGTINMRFRTAEKYGWTTGIYLGGHFEISTNDPEIINEVFIKQFSKFVNRPTQHFGAGYPMNENILQMTKEGVPGRGYGWKEVRSVISPIFTTGKLKAMFPVMEERVDEFVKFLKSRVGLGEIEMYRELQALTLDVIGRCAFGMKTDCINDKNDVFYVNTQTFFNCLNLEESKGMFLGFLSPKLAQMIRPFTLEGRSEMTLINGLKEVIKNRRKTFETDDDQRKDLITLLLEQDRERQKSQKKAPLHEETIASNCYAFLLAGYETTSTALAFTLYALAKHLDVQQNLYEEIMQEIGMNEEITYDVMMKMSYLDAVVKESLRRYPPVVFFTTRECVEDCVIKGINIKKGVCIQAPVHAIHFDPEIWTNPMTFDPNRFLISNNQVDPLKWCPFGLGPRNCVGMRFAEVEIKAALISLIRNFSVELGEELRTKELPCRVSAVLYRPMDGVPLKLNVR
ncbi:unnamed protein product [Bursaphelenchus xylophilus]|uniref:(pine wood nematode) hypothetical protein n=1 Tax=Bursaphelenchus xylophilus TaxID=6326 RepID=A0A1I7RSU3_BURXY|nr:unnamed protein product [Bursaphelenchus xylophilus]CAG9122801.1 unnamed protein product [Bursaphelenchus xylophilus]